MVNDSNAEPCHFCGERGLHECKAQRDLERLSLCPDCGFIHGRMVSCPRVQQQQPQLGSGLCPTPRDQLAMAAPVEEVCMLVSAETYGTDIREIVLARYKWADAMLEAREQITCLGPHAPVK